MIVFLNTKYTCGIKSVSLELHMEAYHVNDLTFFLITDFCL